MEVGNKVTITTRNGPVLVNAKQYKRIIYRRKCREKLKQQGLMPERAKNKNYAKKAQNAQRNAQGRFEKKVRQLFIFRFKFPF